LVRVYEREVERKKLVLKKAELTQQRLLFVVSALRRFLGSEHFVTLLRAEGLDAMPRYLAERVWPERLG
jgi:ParB family chromosome partitioning protein